MPAQCDDHPQPDQVASTEDAVYRHTLREAKIILSLWGIALVYTCTYCYLHGYDSHPSDPATVGPAVSSWFGPLKSFDRDPANLTTPMGSGIPDWVFYGVVLPWIACIVVTFWFCLFVFSEDELGSEQETLSTDGQAAVAGEPRHD